MTGDLYPRLAGYVEARQAAFGLIPAARRSALEEIAGYVVGRISSGEAARLIFICTHNSRRSHLAAIWARLAAGVHEIPRVEVFSGGTEATAFNPRAVEALRRAGFGIEPATQNDNPVYRVRSGEKALAHEVFSRLYDAEPNPTREFCAVMTCAAADAGCPVVPGASARVSLPYDDPGDHDGTGRESDRYDETCREIATEMFYVFFVVRDWWLARSGSSD